MRRLLLAGVLLAASLVAPAAAHAASVTIIVGPQKTLSPPSVAIAPGDTVHWTYAAGSIDHRIRSNAAAGPDAWDFGQHNSGDFPRTFNNSGAFPYHCELHPQDMFGTVSVGLPTAQLAAPSPAQPLTDEVVTLDASGSTDPGGGITSYKWDFDANGTVDDTTGTATTTHAYPTAGTVTTRVTVVDADLHEATTTRSITVRTRVPIPAFTTTPGSVAKGQSVALDAGGSTDNDDTIDEFAWDLDGLGYVVGTSTNSVSYTSAGTKTIKLRVTDTAGHTAELTKTVTVTNQAPAAALSASSTSIANGASVTFNAGGSADGDGTIAGYAWDLDGNGTFETPGGTTPTISHAFTTSGPISVKVQVTDNEGGTAIATVTINVAAPPAPPAPPAGPAAPAPQAPAAVNPALTPPAIAAKAPPTAAAPTGPSLSAPKGQKLKRQKGVKVAVACGAPCQLVLSGSVKVGSKRLRLTRLKKTVSGTATLTLKLDKRDLKKLRKARGKATASVVVAVAGGAAQRLAITLTS